MNNFNGFKRHLDIIFDPGAENKCVYRSIEAIAAEAFGDTIQPSYQREVFAHLLQSTAGRCSGGHRDFILKQATKLFSRVSEYSLDHDDLMWLGISFVPTRDWPEAKKLIYEHAATIYFHTAGASPQRSRQFCRILFDQMKHVVELCAPLSENQAPASAIGFLAFLSKVVFQSAMTPCTSSYPQKQWLLNLVRCHQSGDEQATLWLEGILELLCAHNRELTISVDRPTKFDQIRLTIDYDNPELVVPVQYRDPLVAFVERTKARRVSIGKQAAAFRQWYTQHRAEIRRSFSQKCQEIQAEASRLLYTDGSDEVEVRLSPLYDVGIRSFAFYAARTAFPDVRLLVRVRKDMCVLCDFWAELNQFSIRVPDYVFENFNEPDIDYLREVFAFVVVDAMHSIVVRNMEYGCKKGQGNRAGAVGPVVVRGIRPMMRRLPPNHKASPAAHHSAAAHQSIIPPGRTFVREHDCSYRVGRHQSVPTKIVTCPAYTDEQFQRSIMSGGL